MSRSERARGLAAADDLEHRAVRRAWLALGRFGHGIAHVVLRVNGERRRRRFVVAVRPGGVSVEEAA